MTAARTRSALRAKRARGERAGSVPYGYQVNGNGQTLHLDATEQSVLQVMRDGRTAGQSLTAIAAHLNASGYVTRRGTPWRFEYVGSVLRTAARHAS